MKKAAVILSGSGVFDGAEIQESVITLLALDRANVNVDIFAPDIDQHHVINHLTGNEMDEKRNVLIEAARIARGEIKDLQIANVNDYDMVIFPGGFGVAKNFCDLAFKGKDCEVNPIIEEFIIKAISEKKPLGFMCIAPALLAKVASKIGLKLSLTIGTDPGTAEVIESFGSIHIECQANEIAYDEKNKIVTAPAYMVGKRIHEVADGIEKLISKILEIS